MVKMDEILNTTANKDNKGINPATGSGHPGQMETTVNPRQLHII